MQRAMDRAMLEVSLRDRILSTEMPSNGSHRHRFKNMQVEVTIGWSQNR